MRTAIVAALLSAPLLGAPVQAQRYVLSGATVQLGFFCSINPDCTAAGIPTVRITQPPEHGRVTVSRTRGFCYFQRPNPRRACNRRRVEGVARDNNVVRVHFVAPVDWRRAPFCREDGDLLRALQA